MALSTSFQLGDKTVVNELYFIFQHRIDAFVNRKQLIFILLLIILAIVIHLFVSSYRAVMQTVFALDETSKKMVSGNLSQKTILDNREELGQVVGAFN
ncbi:hypothetical protein [Microcoleus sp. AT3-D2]|uniref:hypothetical protein n=1 Tax=Microcoleus sp. AT3-D2 TaxID=2818612 RepID=UPI002FD04D83